MAIDTSPIFGGVETTSFPEVGHLDIDPTEHGSFYACSATLIAPNVVLTAGHCVDTHAHWNVYVGNAFRESKSAVVYDWNEQGSQSVNPNHHDIGLVFVDKPILLANYPVVARKKVPDDTRVSNFGRISDGKVTSEVYQASTVIRDGASIGYERYYTSPDVIQPGDSGGPAMIDGTHTIVGVNSGSDGHIQVLARVDLVYDWIKTHIDAWEAGKPKKRADDERKPAPSARGAADCSSSHDEEPNDELSQALSLDGGGCGLLFSASDVDWYKLRVSPGKYEITLDAAGDASLLVGRLSSGSVCNSTGSGLKQALVSVVGGDATLCVRVSSRKKTIQSYRLGVR